MALHTELDVYKTGYDLFGKVTKIVANMERAFKHLIGEEIVRESSKLLILVYRANAVSYTHLRAHETLMNLVCRLLLEKKKYKLTYQRK